MSSAGSIQNAVDRVIHPAIGATFRNNAERSDALDFLNNRSLQQANAKEVTTLMLREYGIETVDVLVGNVGIPEELLKTQTDRFLAKEREKTYREQKTAEDTRRELEGATALANQQKNIVAAQASVVPIEYLMTLDEALAQAASSDYAVIGMLSDFALLALVLASTGLFGVVSYAVAQRTAEFGTRMALGARASDVVRLVARESTTMLAIGLAVGLAGGIGVASTMKSVLFGLSPADPLALAETLTPGQRLAAPAG